jgi:branched-subunit amino acid aminotransferase/4-amino-4-deoxychorismate lyase
MRAVQVFFVASLSVEVASMPFVLSTLNCHLLTTNISTGLLPGCLQQAWFTSAASYSSPFCYDTICRFWLCGAAEHFGCAD